MVFIKVSLFKHKHVKQHFEIEFYICNIVSRRVRVALITYIKDLIW